MIAIGDKERASWCLCLLKQFEEMEETGSQAFQLSRAEGVKGNYNLGGPFQKVAHLTRNKVSLSRLMWIAPCVAECALILAEKASGAKIAGLSWSLGKAE